MVPKKRKPTQQENDTPVATSKRNKENKKLNPELDDQKKQLLKAINKNDSPGVANILCSWQGPDAAKALHSKDNSRVSVALYRLLRGRKRDVKEGTSAFTETEMQMMGTLLDNGADLLYMRDQWMPCALYVACESGDVGLVDFLLRRCQDKLLVLPSVEIAKKVFVTIAEKGHVDIFDAESPFLMELFDLCKCEPVALQEILHAAIKTGHENVIQRLMKLNSKLWDFHFAQALNCAAKAGNYQMFLFVQTANPEKFEEIMSQSKEATNLLSLACYGNSLPIVELILQSCVKAKLKSLDFHSSESTVDRWPRQTIENQVLEKEASLHPLAYVRSAQIAETLFKHGDDIEGLDAKSVKTAAGSQALINALNSRSKDLIQVLCDRGVEICSAEMGWSMHELLYKNERATSALCAAGVHIPLDSDGHNSVLSQLLIKAVSTTDNDCCDPRLDRDIDFVEWLIEKGADVNYGNALKCAFECNFIKRCVSRYIDSEVIKCLLESGAKAEWPENYQMLSELLDVFGKRGANEVQLYICDKLIEFDGRQRFPQDLLKRVFETHSHDKKLLSLFLKHGAESPQ